MPGDILGISSCIASRSDAHFICVSICEVH
jgi:hypothetical protein